MNFDITFYRSFNAVGSPVGRSMPWEKVVEALTTHRRLANKMSGPLFAPYGIVPPPAACWRHDWSVEGVTAPHRCDACVTHISMAVFDADQGTVQDVDACDKALGRAGVTRLWYSSYSFDPDKTKVSMRLVIPLDKPLPGEMWKVFREGLIDLFAIPADPKSSKGISHSYFLPSCPPDADPVALVQDTGKFFETDSVPVYATELLSDRELVRKMATWQPPQDTDEPVDLEKFHETLRERATSLCRRKKDEDKERGQVLKALIEGRPLAEHGHRDTTVTRTAMSLAYMFPEASLRELLALMHDSLRAMQQEGSKLTEATVERKILTGMRKAAESRERDRAMDEMLSNYHNEMAEKYARS